MSERDLQKKRKDHAEEYVAFRLHEVVMFWSTMLILSEFMDTKELWWGANAILNAAWNVGASFVWSKRLEKEWERLNSN